MRQTNSATCIVQRQFGIDLDRDAEMLAIAEKYGLAQMIHDARQEAGLTQRQLAKPVGTTQSVISQLESADYKGHSLSMLRRIATALDRPVEIRLAPASHGQGTHRVGQEFAYDRRRPIPAPGDGDVGGWARRFQRLINDFIPSERTDAGRHDGQSETGGDEADHHRNLGRLLHDMRAEARPLASADDRVIEACGQRTREHDERLVREGLQLDFLYPGRSMLARHGDDEILSISTREA